MKWDRCTKYLCYIDCSASYEVLCTALSNLTLYSLYVEPHKLRTSICIYCRATMNTNPGWQSPTMLREAAGYASCTMCLTRTKYEYNKQSTMYFALSSTWDGMGVSSYLQVIYQTCGSITRSMYVVKSTHANLSITPELSWILIWGLSIRDAVAWISRILHRVSFTRSPGLLTD